MDFTSIKERLGLSKFPEYLKEYYGKRHPVSLCTEDTLREIEEKYSIFGNYTEKIIECLRYVSKSEELLCYINASLSYISENDIPEAKALPQPKIDTVGCMAYYRGLVLAALMPSAIQRYKERGFSEEEIYATLNKTIEIRIAVAESNNGKPGVDVSAFNWLIFYAKALVFYNGVFNVTPKHFDDRAVILQNKTTGEIKPIITNDVIHRDGGILGSTGFEDEEGSFPADFIETDEYYEGYETKDALVINERKRFHKSEWNVLLTTRYGIAGIHIPRGANLSEDVVRRGLYDALTMTKKHYPEYNARAVYCASWMIDPQLEKILGAESKIVSFMKKFTTFPRRDYGGAIFGFVFPQKPENYNDLPESTSLQRKLKQLYLDGKYIYSPAGVYVPGNE